MHHQEMQNIKELIKVVAHIKKEQEKPVAVVNRLACDICGGSYHLASHCTDNIANQIEQVSVLE